MDVELQIREDALNIIKTHLEKTHIKMKIQADKSQGPTEFKEGDWVFVELQPYRQITLAY